MEAIWSLPNTFSTYELSRLAHVPVEEIDKALDELQDAGLISYERVSGFESLRRVRMNMLLKPTPRQMRRESKRRGLDIDLDLQV